MRFSLIHFRTLGSTQRHAEAEIRAGRLTAGHGPTVFVAEEQLGGVGRFERAWSSPRGGLWCTFVAPIEGPVHELADGLGLRVGVACAEFVASLLPSQDAERVRLKWPNDVLIDGRKVLGVLTSVVGTPTTAWILLGIGLNANLRQRDLPAAIRGAATTLLVATGRTIPLSDALVNLETRLGEALRPTGVTPEVLGRAGRLLYGVGRGVMVSLPTGVKIEATLVGLDRTGEAVFEQDGSRWVAPPSTILHHAG